MSMLGNSTNSYSRLARDGALFEIEAIAVVPEQ